MDLFYGLMVYIVAFWPVTAQQTDDDAKTLKLIRNLVREENMDPSIRPRVAGPPINVSVGFYILTLGAIDEVHMDYTADIFFRMRWNDPRLRYTEIEEDLVIEPKMIELIWTPDIYFPNEKYAEFHEVTVPNRVLTISPDGNCTYSIRITMTAACPMDLSHFPMDRQECDLKVESYSHTTRHMSLQWLDGQAIEVDDEMQLPEMQLTEVRMGRCDKTYALGRYPCLKATFVLVRLYGFFILQTFIPSVLIVILSWVSFWINIDAVPARISLGVTTVLTMTTQLSGTKGSIPKVSYPKAIDVWMSVCMMFVFAALLEFAFVNALTRRNVSNSKNKKDEATADSNSEDKQTGFENDAKCSNDNLAVQSFRVKLNKCVTDRQAAKLLDHMSRFVFPGAFVLFNAIYWSIYLQ